MAKGDHTENVIPEVGEHHNTESNLGSSPTDSDETSSGEAISTAIIIFVVLIFSTALITITGGTVYAAYGWRGQGSGPNGTLLTAVVGMLSETPVAQYIPEFLINQAITENQCPPVLSTCPPVIECADSSAVTTCKPQREPPCIPEVVPERKCPTEFDPCPAGECRDIQCPTQRPPPSFDMFFKISRDAKTVFEWLNTYPPYSAERLQVVTFLLDETVEKWASAGFMHNCDDQNPWITCTFCNDRYNYIKCVMSNTLIKSMQSDVESALLIPKGTFFDNAKKDMPLIIMTENREYLPYQLDPIFDEIERTIKAFRVETENGRICEVCADFNRLIYDECFSKGKKYTLPSQRSS